LFWIEAGIGEQSNSKEKKLSTQAKPRRGFSLADGLLPLVDQGPFGREGAEVGKLKIFGKKMGERGGVSPLFLGSRFLEPPKDSRDQNPNRT
jgi:hypothetical protein